MTVEKSLDLEREGVVRWSKTEPPARLKMSHPAEGAQAGRKGVSGALNSDDALFIV